MLPSEVLTKAADLIEPEGRWIQGGASKNAAGQFLGAGGAAGPSAVCWCALGAIIRFSGADQNPTAFLRRALPATTIAEWNDFPGRTQAEVVAALRKASELAKAEGQ